MERVSSPPVGVRPTFAVEKGGAALAIGARGAPCKGRILSLSSQNSVVSSIKPACTACSQGFGASALDSFVQIFPSRPRKCQASQPAWNMVTRSYGGAISHPRLSIMGMDALNLGLGLPA